MFIYVYIFLFKFVETKYILFKVLFILVIQEHGASHYSFQFKWQLYVKI